MRRRRRKYTWFPNLGTDIPGDAEWSGRAGFIGIRQDGALNTLVFPLTVDDPEEQPAPGTPGELVKVIGNEYVIERIVGKLHAAFIPFTAATAGTNPFGLFGGANGTGQPAAARLTAGLFVARAESDLTGGPDLPIGAQTPDQLNLQYSPMNVQVIREPWMWRRTWVLRNGLFDILTATTAVSVGGSAAITPPATAFDGAQFPSSTTGYGSLGDGAHVDVKSVRRVGQDDRLWLALSTVVYPLGSVRDPEIAASNIRFEFDYRILGALRRPRQRGVF